MALSMPPPEGLELWHAADVGLPAADDMRDEADAFFDSCFPWLSDLPDENGLQDGGEPQRQHRQDQQQQQDWANGSASGGRVCSPDPSAPHPASAAAVTASSEHATQGRRATADPNTYAGGPAATQAGALPFSTQCSVPVAAWGSGGPAVEHPGASGPVSTSAPAGSVQGVFSHAAAGDNHGQKAPAPGAQQVFPQQQLTSPAMHAPQQQGQGYAGDLAASAGPGSHPVPGPFPQRPAPRTSPFVVQAPPGMALPRPTQLVPASPAAPLTVAGTVKGTGQPLQPLQPVQHIQPVQHAHPVQHSRPLPASSGSSRSRELSAESASGAGGLPPAAADEAATAAAAARSRSVPKRRTFGTGHHGGGGAARLHGTSTAAIKDTTKRKNAEIARLEVELQQKLALATNLQRQNQELAAKERLLKLQVVSAGERMLYCESVHGITPHLASLIQGFRSSYNQHIGANLLAGMSKDPKALGIDEFRTMWQSFVHEVADLMVQSDQEAAMADVCDRVANWCMSVCIYSPGTMDKAPTINMKTGEDLPPDMNMDFYKGLVAKLELDEQQVADLRSIFSLYCTVAQRTTQDVSKALMEISRLVNSDTPQAAVQSLQFLVGQQTRVNAMEGQETLFKKLQVCQRQCNLVHTMMAFLVLSVLNPKQKGVMIFDTFPSFPQMKFLLMAAVQ